MARPLGLMYIYILCTKDALHTLSLHTTSHLTSPRRHCRSANLTEFFFRRSASSYYYVGLIDWVRPHTPTYTFVYCVFNSVHSPPSSSSSQPLPPSHSTIDTVLAPKEEKKKRKGKK